MPFTLHLDKDGKPQFNDKGVPLYMQPGGAEPVAMDVNELIDTNRAKSGAEAAAKKEAAELIAKLKAFEGLDAVAARKALELAKSLDEGKLLEAGKVDEIRQKAVAEERQKITNLEKALEDTKASGQKAVNEKEQMIHDLLVKDAFSNSTFLREKTVLPAEFAYASLGRNFTVEYQNGKPVVIAKDGQGNPLFSQSNPSAYAGPEEAIKILIEQHPQKDSLLKAPNPSGGSGAAPNQNARSATGKTMSRAQFDGLDAAAKVKTMSEGYTLTD
jgi:hypothetical protein